MARVSKRALVKQFDPKSPIYKTKGDLLWGEYAHTPAQNLVTTWIGLWHERRHLLAQLTRLAQTEQPTRSTLDLKKHLETWFAGVERFDWEHQLEKQSRRKVELNFRVPAVRLLRFPSVAELNIRAAAVRLLQSVRNAEDTLVATVRAAILEPDSGLFRQLAGVLDLYKTLSAPPFAADPVRYTLIELAQRQRAADDALLGKPSSGLNQPVPAFLAMTIVQIQQHVKERTGLIVDVAQLRRMCKEIGTSPKPGQRGRPAKKR